MTVRKGDTVLGIAGKEKGKRGKGDKVHTQGNKVEVEGINLIVRHVRPRPNVRQAGRVQKESPLHMSNVMLVCNKCNAPTRVKLQFLEDGRKVRTCLQCKETID